MTQYRSKIVNLKYQILFFLGLLSFFTIPMLILNTNITIWDKIWLFLTVILISFIIPVFSSALQLFTNKKFPNLDQDPYRHLINALATANLEVLVNEVKRIENLFIKGETPKYLDRHLFWFFKAYLLLFNGDIKDACLILKSLKKFIRKRFALRGEIDLLLALNTSDAETNTETLQLLLEAKRIFTKTKILEPLTLINQQIMLLQSKIAM